MATGGFAGGLAQGLRNGWSMADGFRDTVDRMEARAERNRLRDSNKAIQDNIASAAENFKKQASQGAGLVDLAQVQAAPSVDPGQTLGLQAVQTNPGVAPTASIGEQAPGLQGQPPVPGTQPTSTGAGLSDVKASFDLPQRAPGTNPMGDPEIGSALAGLSAGVQTALSKGRIDVAINLMAQRERIAAPHRDKAYGQAMSQFQLSNDPNVFVPFVNNYLPAGMHIDGIKQAATTKDGMPIYEVSGTEYQSGKPFTRAVSGGQLQSFIQGVGDPETQKALFVQQSKRLFDRQQAIFNSNLKTKEEAAKPRAIGKDQTLVVPGEDGTVRTLAFGSEASPSAVSTKRVNSQIKDYQNYLLKLNGVDSLEGITLDKRGALQAQQLVGESLLRANVGGKAADVLQGATLADISQKIGSGAADLSFAIDRNGKYTIFAKTSVGPVKVPSSVVPPSRLKELSDQIEKHRQGRNATQPTSEGR